MIPPKKPPMRGPDYFKEQPTSVYVMREGARCKIGIAADPDKRRLALRATAGLEIEMVASRVFSTRLSAASVERALHKRFAKRRLPGEWFAMPTDLAVAALNGARDPELHVHGWEPHMPLAIAASPLMRFVWRRNKRLGRPLPTEAFDSDDWYQPAGSRLG